MPNWADGEAIRPMAPEAACCAVSGGWRESSRSGNLGRAHDCETLLAAARLLARRSATSHSRSGGGFHFARLRDTELANVQVRGYVPKDRLADSLAACDVHRDAAARFRGLIVPSKFYSIAAAGRAAIFVGDPDGEIGARDRTVQVRGHRGGGRCFARACRRNQGPVLSSGSAARHGRAGARRVRTRMGQAHCARAGVE
jgi:hypothetical protein